jgi:PPOX class probable F420-dependent enzyme
MEAINLAELYQTPLLDWARIEDRLRAGVTQVPDTGGPNRHTCWLATTNPDGSPHVTGVGALWADGCFWFETGQRTRKGRNLARDPRCALSVATQEFDLVVEGDAAVVTDPATVADMAARWAAEGWPGPGRRHGAGAHRRVQRSLGRAAAMTRLPSHAAHGDGAGHRRPGRRGALAVLAS